MFDIVTGVESILLFSGTPDYLERFSSECYTLVGSQSLL